MSMCGGCAGESAGVQHGLSVSLCHAKSFHVCMYLICMAHLRHVISDAVCGRNRLKRIHYSIRP